ncbi:hypothetical protein CPC16_000999 [Podila verticillata]|nr:hypothetical protein CPC16_000999 [Podila verticillata]
MPLGRCRRCNGLVLKPAQPSPHTRLTNLKFRRRRQRRSSILLPFLLLIVSATVAQASFTYTPRYSAASTVINRTLYLAAGTTIGAASSAYSDLVSLSLQESFSTSSPPWKALAKIIGNPVAEARMAPSADLQHLLLVGIKEPEQLVSVYDIDAGNWSAPSISGNPPNAPRQSLGIVLDPLTRRNVIFGGYSVQDATRELDVLDTNVNIGQWTWLSTTGATNMPTLLQPIMLYVPLIGASLVMGGCSSQYVCMPFTNVFLIQFTDTGVPIVNNRTVTSTNGILPQPRTMPCVAVLKDSSVLMYGGMGYQEGNSDFWILDTVQWSWSRVPIADAPKQARSGATCELVGRNQVMVIGGFVGSMMGEKTFSDPQVAIIDMDSRTWTTKYVTSSSSSLSLGAIIGISVGCSVVLCFLFFLLGRMAYKRHQEKKMNHRHQNRASNVDSLSSLPLMDPTKGLVSTRVLRDEPLSISLSSTKSRSSLPLIITPYSPPVVASISSSEISSATKLDTQRMKDEEFPESERMTIAMADKQHSQYFKTQQHGKQYERRRQLEGQLQSNNTSLNRSGTHYTYKDDPEDEIELATGMIHLREVELGEESIMTRLNGLETGAILVSSHVDASGRNNHQHNNNGWQQQNRRPSQGPSRLARTTHMTRDYQGS